MSAEEFRQYFHRATRELTMQEQVHLLERTLGYLSNGFDCDNEVELVRNLVAEDINNYPRRL